MSGVHKINIKSLAINLGISLGVGILSGLLSMSGMDSFEDVVKPPLTPPGFIFPIVWTILFTLMGISAYLISQSEANNKSTAFIIYGLQLAVNFFWPIFFFNMQAYLFSFIWLILLLILIIAMIVSFMSVNKTAAYLQIPYLLWAAFATYLNFGVFLLNPKL